MQQEDLPQNHFESKIDRFFGTETKRFTLRSKIRSDLSRKWCGGKKRIISQMFDIRPLGPDGGLHWEKIKKVLPTVRLAEKEYVSEKITGSVKEIKVSGMKHREVSKLPRRELASQSSRQVPIAVRCLTKKSWMDDKKVAEKIKVLPRKREAPSEIPPRQYFSEDRDYSSPGLKIVREEKKYQPSEKKEKLSLSEKYEKKLWKKDIRSTKNDHTNSIGVRVIPSSSQVSEKVIRFPIKDDHINDNSTKEHHFKFSHIFFPLHFAWAFNHKRIAFSFAVLAIFTAGALAIWPLSKNLAEKKSKVLGTSTQGYQKLEEGIQSLKERDFNQSQLDFSESQSYFSSASRELGTGSSTLAEIAKYFPFVSRFSSGKFSIEAGKHLAVAGDELAEIAKILENTQNSFSEKKDPLSLLGIYQSLEEHLRKAAKELETAEKNLEKVNIDQIPEDKKEKFFAVREKIPPIVTLINKISFHSDLVSDILGGNGPRKYLFLFQNNNEMRATGGFIGSYGLLDIKDGHVRKFFIDGIFEPDGQLKEKIVPPSPIQKISEAWSLHDSNWWPDFPRSAKKAMVFFEKTGSPTVDGVITVTPEVMKKFLEITGPIYLPEYDITLDAQNFVEKTHYEVEADYDQEENQPKKILSDLAPLVLEKIFNTEDTDTILKTIKTMESGLSEKHILIYSDNKKVQEIISGLGWSGEIKETSGDYLSVINTNINGFKTDGVIEEKIRHEAEVQEDGSITVNVTVTRIHNGGDSPYEWWNKVNADYMRLYVPLGSKLISVDGQTREFTNPPLEYDQLGFKRDEDVDNEEKSMEINYDTGTRTYEDSGKTVFANWVYVSPKETVTIKYQYLLPFSVLTGGSEDSDSYSLLVQKQSGSAGSEFQSRIKFPGSYEAVWKYPDFEMSQNSANFNSTLTTDKFIAIVFQKK